MRKHLLTLVALTVFLLSISTNVKATHLMGGSLTYEYLGLNSTSGLFEYRITITIYRYCEAGSTLLPTSLDMGVYEDDPGNPTGDKLLVETGTIPLLTIQSIQPPNANDSCTFAPNVCVEEGVYQAVISVPANTTGYYFISDRCCRNNNIVNLDDPANDGQAYYAFAPPTNVVNNSPTFAAAPVPFICAMDTATILNQAYDLDGDLLVYNFVVPFNGISDGGNPVPIPPATYTWPVPLVTYAAGYSLANPFGAGGAAFISSSTGLATYYAPFQGFYVLAVEIQEFRNGVLIGVTRRDLQIIVIPCPINPAPVLSSGLQTSYVIDEGQTLCFTTSFLDTNGDSLYITHTGDIFNPLITVPTATFTDGSGAATATGDFCWTTDCSQGRTTPYQFSVNATDNGCPAKITNIVYTITVTNTLAPLAITGPDTLCLNAAGGVTYSIPSVTGATYDWFISGGIITGPTNGTSVDATFSSPGQAILGATNINGFGCTSDTTYKTVEIVPIPIAFAGPDVQFCSGGTANLGGSTSPGYTYSWSPSAALSDPTISNPTVTIINGGSTPITTTYVVTTTLSGCSNTDTVVVTTVPNPGAVAGPDVSICSGETISIGSATIAGLNYTWTPSTGLSNSGISDPTVTLTNVLTVPVTHWYYLTVQNGFGCSSFDSMSVQVNPIPVAVAGADIIFCDGNTGSLGGASTAGYTYSWSPATGLSSGAASNPTVTLSNSLSVNDTINYILTTTQGPCSSTDTVQVIVKPSPLSNAGTNQLFCGSGTLQLGTATTPGYSYSWTPSGGLNDTTISDPTLTISNSGTTPDTLLFIVTTTLNGCTSSDSILVISSPAPIAGAGPDAIICSGETTTIGTTGVAGYNYSWTPITGLSNSGVAIPTVTLTNTTLVEDTVTYILTVDAYGCIATDTVTIIVRPLPVSEAGTNAVLCGGDTLTLGTATTPGYSYSWNPATLLSSTIISNPVAIYPNTTGAPITYNYTVTTTWNGCETSDSVTVTVNPQPIVAAAASPISICLGENATLTGSGATNYSWALLTAPQTSIGTDSIFTVTPTGTTTYILTGTNSFSCSNQDTVTVTVNPLPVVQITAPSQSICDGDTILLTANGATTYSWSQSGGGVIGTGSSILVNPTVNTTYYVTGTDGNTCTATDSITITVNPAATLSSAGGTLSVCPGVTGVTYWVNNFNPNSTYNWILTNGTIVTGQGGDTITVDWSSVAGTGTVTVVEVTDLGCSSEPITLTVSINVILTPVAPTGPTVFCANTAQGISYTTLNTPGSTYSWIAQGGTVVSGDGTSSIIVDWTTAGPATVYLYYNESSTTSTNVCFGTSDTLEITINPVPVTSAITGPVSICVTDTGSFSVINTSTSTYAWTISGGTILSGNGTNTVTANWSGSGTATLNVQETNSFGCIGNVVSIPITVNALPAANAGTDVGVCIGQGVQLSASGGVGYSWSPSTGLNNVGIFNPVASPVTSTSYVVLVTDNNGCMNTDTILVTVNPLPIITMIGNSAICIGGSIQFNATGGTSYSWSPAGNLSNPLIPDPVANPTVTTVYTVTVTNSNGCVDSSSMTLTVNPLPVAVTSADTIICDGSSTTLIASGGVSYSWSPSGSLNNPNIYNPVATPNGPTIYTVTVTDVNGCTDDEDLTVSINPQPIAQFVIDPTVLQANCNGAEVTLLNTSIDALNYSWLFPDGTTSTDENVTHMFQINADNFITLTAFNNFCVDDTTVNYNSILASNILKNMPNVFTPNGDGKNDCYDLGVLVNFHDCSSVTIYDRWGEVIFTNGDGKDCWNGKKNNTGEDFTSGTYFLTVVIAGEKLKATITLLR